MKLPRKKLGASAKDDKFYHRPLQVISIKTLRDYLDLEMRPVAKQMKIPYDLERIIDDYVFLCIFVGNDFLPSLPLFDIREGAVTMLLNMYRRLLPTWSDYIIRPGGEINYLQVQSLMREVYANEGNILRRKRLFGRYTVGRLKRPAMQSSSLSSASSASSSSSASSASSANAVKAPELGDEESVKLVNLFIKHMVENAANSAGSAKEKSVDYVKAIQMYALCSSPAQIRPPSAPAGEGVLQQRPQKRRKRGGSLPHRWTTASRAGATRTTGRSSSWTRATASRSSASARSTCWAWRGSCATTARAARPGTGSTPSTTRRCCATSPR